MAGYVGSDDEYPHWTASGQLWMNIMIRLRDEHGWRLVVVGGRLAELNNNIFSIFMNP